MSNENHNNWKRKLEELSGLPGENLDKNASWGKLYARFGGKRRNKKAVWYWVAAACLLFALMIPVMILNKKTHQLASVEIKQKPPETKTSVATMINKKDSIKNVNPVLSEKNETIIADKFNNAENKIIPQKQINKIRLYDTVSTQTLVTETNNNSLQPIDTSSYLAAIIPAKKKLKVVHINELGDPAEVPPDLARDADKRSFLSLKLANGEVYNNPSGAFTKSDFTFLKMKLFSN